MNHSLWHIVRGDSPVVATALHDGHEIREEVVGLLAVDELTRLREEDPGTGQWTSVAETRIVFRKSRFEVDLNRPRSKAVYISPEDAWGLQVWKEPPTAEVIEGSLQEYDAFYAEVHRILSELERHFGRFVVFDLHSYNHRREGPDGPVADWIGNPEVDVEIDSSSRMKWRSLVDRFIAELRVVDFLGRRLDVRENTRFQAGHFCRWIHDNFPDTGCAIAVEFKKTYMDEWRGAINFSQLHAITMALKSAVSGVLEELK